MPDATKNGSNLIKALYYITNALKIHQDNNLLVRENIEKFNSILSGFSEGNDFELKIWRGRFFLQSDKLMFQRESFHFLNKMMDYFNQRGISCLTFHSEYFNTEPEEILAFFRILNDATRYNDPRAWLDEEMLKNSFPWIDLSLDQEEDSMKSDAWQMELARFAYFQAINTVKDVAIKTSRGFAAGVRKARRLAQTLVDMIEKNGSLLLGMSTIRQYDDYTYNHSVNVAILAACLGSYLGLSQKYLEHLTVCGLFHDLGKAEISKDILLKQGSLSEEEWKDMQKHPLVGIRQILNLNAPHVIKSRIILGPFEHHINVDLSGYPKTHFMKNLSLMGMILHIADVYEALTAYRIYRQRSFSPEEALRRMWSEVGTSFDHLLLKSFINMMGIYPVGSFVELDTGEFGLVMEYADDSDRNQPVIKLLKDDGSGNLSSGETINLAHQNDGHSPLRNIIAGIHQDRLGIHPGQFFLQMTEPEQKILTS